MELADSMEELRRQNEELVRAIQDAARQLAELRRDMETVRAEYYKHAHGATSSAGITTTITLPS